MNREPYWDYMGRRLREDRIKNEVLTYEDLCKKEIADMQKTLQWCYIRIKELNILFKKMTFKEKANMFYRLKRLLDSSEMGSLFRVLFAHKKGKKFSLGF